MSVAAVNEVAVKLVLAGAPGSGRAEMLRAFADRIGGVPLREGTVGAARVQRVETIWPEPLADGRVMRLRVFAATGAGSYNAVEQLLLSGADGLVFLLDVTPESLRFGWDALLLLADNLRRAGLEFDSVPMAVQYHRCERHDDFSAKRMDDWLKLPAGDVPRFVTESDAPDAAGGAIDAVIDIVARNLVASES